MLKLKTIWPSSNTIAGAALLVSFASAYFAAQTYFVAHRPYIGIVDMPHNLVNRVAGEPPYALVWRVILKNTGSIPGFVTVEDYVASVTMGSRIVTLPRHGDPTPTTSMVLMAGGTGNLLGAYSEVAGPTTMKDILEGKAILDVRVRIS